MVRSAPRSVPHRKLAASRATAKRRTNRRRINWPRRLLVAALLTLAVECVVVALLSPRFAIRKLTLQGVESLSPALVREQLTLEPGQNLLLAPTSTWERQIERIPGVASASVERQLPGTIRIVVEERVPWATLRTKDGRWHTIDSSFTPFRVRATPEQNLPRILASDIAPWEVVPGMPISSPGLPTAQLCERWSRAHRELPLTQIEIDPRSKVCLNRVGKVPIHLGTGEGIRQKLTALEKLLAARPDLSYSTDIAYVNLLAPDAPAIGLLPPKKPKP